MAEWLQVASLWSAPCATGKYQVWSLESLFPFFLQWPWCLQSCSSHIFSPCSSLAAVLSAEYSFFLLWYHRGITTTANGIGHGQWQVPLRAFCHWLHHTSRKLLGAYQRTHPCRPPATKTARQTQYWDSA